MISPGDRKFNQEGNFHNQEVIVHPKMGTAMTAYTGRVAERLGNLRRKPAI